VSVIASKNLILNGGFDYGTIDPSKNGGTYLQSNQAGYINPFWTESGDKGKMGLAMSGSTWVDDAAPLDVGTYAFYMQTKSGSAAVSVCQSFTVACEGVYKLGFSHAKRNKNRIDPTMRVRIYKGANTSGEVLYEVASVASSHAAVDGVFGTFSQDVKIREAGTYTLEFYRPSGATVDTTTILDNVSFTYDRKIQKGLTILFY
jgi:hypothetical protein